MTPASTQTSFFAKKINALTFKFAGEVKGTSTQDLEGVPTMDTHNRFCFVSPREYERTFSTLYCGVFNDGTVRGVHRIGETLSRKQVPWFNMDVEISADGNTLYYTENEWDPAVGLPKSSNIHVALRENGRFKRAETRTTGFVSCLRASTNVRFRRFIAVFLTTAQ